MWKKFNGDLKWITKALGVLFLIAILFGMFLHNRAESLEYKPGKKHLNVETAALLLHLNGKLIEYVYRPTVSSCLKSKRVAMREIGGERVMFSCKVIQANLEEDSQSKYGLRIIKILTEGV
mgnify:FL=1